jgi:hypothetical protein
MLNNTPNEASDPTHTLFRLNVHCRQLAGLYYHHHHSLLQQQFINACKLLSCGWQQLYNKFSIASYFPAGK